jgi:hypothetical protein
MFSAPTVGAAKIRPSTVALTLKNQSRGGSGGAGVASRFKTAMPAVRMSRPAHQRTRSPS